MTTSVNISSPYVMSGKRLEILHQEQDSNGNWFDSHSEFIVSEEVAIKHTNVWTTKRLIIREVD